MTPDEKLDAIRSDLTRLRVSVAVLRVKVDELGKIRSTVRALERWRWKMAGLSGAILFVGEPIWALLVSRYGTR